MSKKKNGRETAVMKKRVPWHVTLFTGGAWFLLMAGLRPEVILVSSIMILGGILYLCWPKTSQTQAAAILSVTDTIQPTAWSGMWNSVPGNMCDRMAFRAAGLKSNNFMAFARAVPGWVHACQPFRTRRP